MTLMNPPHSVAVFVALAIIIAGSGQLTAQPQLQPAVPEERQFDFWIGEWHVQNRFKQEDHSWKDEGTATVKIYPVLDGKAVMEFWSGTAAIGKETKGFSLRYYDAASQKWKLALNWPRPNNGGFFFLDGQFRHHRGEFFTQYPNPNGENVLLRYTFSDITGTSLRWDNGKSLDSGKTWETNWIMEFHRTAEKPQWPSIDEPFHTFDNNSWNTTPEGKRFDMIAGRWKGQSQSNSLPESGRGIEMKVWRVLNGSAYLMVLQTEERNPLKEIWMLTYRETNALWLLLKLDNQNASGFSVFGWKVADASPVFEKLPKEEHPGVRWSLDALTTDIFSATISDEKNGTIRKLEMTRL